jgi:hydroxyquinol 1,2-dioxygenase
MMLSSGRSRWPGLTRRESCDVRDLNETNVTEAVLGQMRASDPRLQTLLESLVRHLHAFVREVELTEGEWLAAIRFLTAVGQISDDKRQEFILLSDVLGLSILVDAINHRKFSGGTESTVTGPFWVSGAPELEHGATIARGEEAVSGEITVVHGRVIDGEGRSIEGAVLDVWQASPAGMYDVQDPDQPEMNLRGIFRSGDGGEFWFKTVKPAAYPIPDDGPVGDLLKATGRHPMRPAHIHFMVRAPGYKPLTTHIFVEGDPYLESDAVFGVKDSLVVDFDWNNSKDEAARYGLEAPYIDVGFEIVLESGQAAPGATG